MRIIIRGVTGTGKSTLAEHLAARYALDRIDMDELFHLPGWQSRPEDEFERLLEERTRGDRWVMAGNYTRTEPLLLPRATHVVWLVYGRTFSFSRLLFRTLRRVVRNEPCCNGNYESWSRTLSRESILLWHIKTYGKVKRRAEQALRTASDDGREIVILRSDREANRWMHSLGGP